MDEKTKKVLDEVKDAMRTDESADKNVSNWLGNNKLALNFVSGVISGVMEEIHEVDLHPIYLMFIGEALAKISRDRMDEINVYNIEDMTHEDREYLNTRTTEAIKRIVSKSVCNANDLLSKLPPEKQAMLLKAIKERGYYIDCAEEKEEPKGYN